MTNQILNYKIGQTLGQGTFGKVKYGLHNITNEPVAIKILDKKMIEEQGDVERVNREIAILRKVRHPNIIQLYEVIETQDKIYLIMEYASGGELFEHIVKLKKIPEQQCSKYLQQIISGIEYIHKLGITHRDLKPENMLFDKDYNIKIADFGLSNIYTQGNLLSTPCGSPCYAAPEMIQGQKYDADIWSSGIIFYACLCGFLPFDHNDIQKLYQKIILGEFVNPHHLSREAKILLKGMLTTNTQKRYKIKDIRQSEFYLKNVQGIEPKGVIVGIDTIFIDESIIDMIFSKDQQKERNALQEQILQNRHNQNTITYYLLLQKMGERITQVRQKRSFSNAQDKNEFRQKRSMSNAQDKKHVDPQQLKIQQNKKTNEEQKNRIINQVYKKFSPQNYQQQKIEETQSVVIQKNEVKQQILNLRNQKHQENMHRRHISADFSNKAEEIQQQIDNFKNQREINDKCIQSPVIIKTKSPKQIESPNQIIKKLRVSQAKSLHQSSNNQIIKKHKTFINLNCVIQKSSILIFQNLLTFGKMMKLDPQAISKYQVQFKKNQLKFTAEIKSLGTSYYIFFKKQNGIQNIYNDETLQLLRLLQF